MAPLPGCTVPPGQILDEPVIAGALTDVAVREAVFQQLDRVGACVDWAVSYDLLAPGQLVVRLAVSPVGRVTLVDVPVDHTGADQEFQSCLWRAFADLVFPRAGAVTWICYPINVDYD